MAKYIFKFPDIGEGLEEGIILEWKVKKGQRVEAGDILVVMETDKVAAEIPSPKSGIITQLFGKEGDVVKVGEALVEIDLDAGEDTAPLEEAAKAVKVEAVEEEGAGVVGTLEVATGAAVMRASDEGVVQQTTQTGTKRRRVLATPVARAMAKDLGVDINQVKGTGPGGRVTKKDILQYVEKQKKAPVSTMEAQETTQQQRVEIEPLSQIRKTIAQNMIRSKHNAAHMAVFDEVEISNLVEIRNRYKEIYAKEGIKLTYLPFILKATALALKKHKQLNAEMDLEGGKMIYKYYYNIGIAVDTPRGLIVPVIRDVDKLSIKQIAIEIQNITRKVEENKITLDDMRDGTFSVTSYGSIGGKFAFPVINYPQVGILGIGRISDQPVVRQGQVVVGKVLPLSISADHRVVDGAEVSRFLNTLMSYLADPISMMLE